MSVRTRLGFVILLAGLLASCSTASDQAGEVSTTSLDESPTTTTVATTTTSPPSTTTTEATTTATSYIRTPSDEERESYLLAAVLFLNEGPYSPDSMGSDEWAVMLRDGAIAACEAFAQDAPLTEVIGSAVAETPLANQEPSEYDATGFSLMFTLVSSGTQAFCPSVAPDFTENRDEAAENLTNAWLEFQGEEPLDAEGWIRDGTWAVGVDIEPGQYRNAGSDGCYWERVSDFSGESSSVIANGYPNGDPAIVTIAPTDAGFISEDCGRWTPDE